MRSEDVLQFWLEDTSEQHWFAPSDGLDDRIRALFAADWGRAVAGQLSGWADTPRGALAFIILTDQFPRNMFRGKALAFAADAIARDAARAALDAGHDMQVDPPARAFFYMPFNHSEDIADQDRCCALFAERMPEPDHLLHSAAHRQVIAEYGRFPFRNDALGRPTSSAEQAFLDAGAYGGLVRRMKESHAASA